MVLRIRPGSKVFTTFIRKVLSRKIINSLFNDILGMTLGP